MFIKAMNDSGIRHLLYPGCMKEANLLLMLQYIQGLARLLNAVSISKILGMCKQCNICNVIFVCVCGAIKESKMRCEMLPQLPFLFRHCHGTKNEGLAHQQNSSSIIRIGVNLCANGMLLNKYLLVMSCTQ